MQVLGEVPAQREVTVPQEGRAPLCRNLRATQIVHVAFLQFSIGMREVRIERDALWQIVDAEGLGECHPLRFRLRFLERLPRLIDW